MDRELGRLDQQKEPFSQTSGEAVCPKQGGCNQGERTEAQEQDSHFGLGHDSTKLAIATETQRAASASVASA